MTGLPPYTGMLTVADGELSYVQAVALTRRLGSLRNPHWHFNDCKCCVTVHGHDETYVIGRDGDETLYPGRGCDCP